MTTTIESLFGSGRMAAGFFLNNELTDFSLAPLRADGAPAANAVAAGKRPRSSMSPVLILDREGRLVGDLETGTESPADQGAGTAPAETCGVHDEASQEGP